jgi:hypothetical protein
VRRTASGSYAVSKRHFARTVPIRLPHSRTDALVSGFADEPSAEDRHPTGGDGDSDGNSSGVGTVWLEQARSGNALDSGTPVVPCPARVKAATDDTEVAMSRPVTGPGGDDDPRRVEPGVDGPPVVVEEERVVTKPARTSAAAAFALAFGVAAFVCVLIVILSPVGLVLGIIGLILGVLGLRAARRVGITGKGVAIAGLVLSALAIVISIAFAAGVVTVLNNDSAVERIEQQVDKMRDKIPDNVEVPQP